MIFPNIGVQAPQIFLPNPKLVDFHKWAIIACDQFTSEPAYWEKVANYVGHAPSALQLILPELYLESPDLENRITQINQTMQDYLSQNILTPLAPGFMYTERQITADRLQQGIVLSVDLDKFDFSATTTSLIRPTEGTIIERIPPRLKIRKNASLELPHILLLINDPQQTVIEPLAKLKSTFTKAYDFPLMFNNQQLTGYHITEQKHLQSITNALTNLLATSQNNNPHPLLFAVGDGNHSLATAKTHWDNLKTNLTSEEQQNHPARFALVEVVNLYNDSLIFEPIHRIIFNTDVHTLFDFMHDFYSQHGTDFSYDLNQKPPTPQHNAQIIPFQFEHQQGYLHLRHTKHLLAVGSLQTCLDAFLKKHPNAKIDYIHGEDSLTALAQKPQSIGFFLPAIAKDTFFQSILQNGALPRKTFSIGHAQEKRFYLEAKKIIS